MAKKYPGHIIQEGDSGQDVKDIQSRLKTLGYNVGSVDGIFGPDTKSAVEVFQQNYGLEVDGKVGPDTWLGIFTASDHPSYPGELIGDGSQGNNVKAIQARLNAYGYQTTVDGIYGSDTRNKVEAFQRDEKLAVDGIVGEDTWEQLFQTFYHAYGGTVLGNGSSGTSVKELQQRLSALGYKVGTIDGIYGSNTESAVKAFQRDVGLSVDGLVGENTWKALFIGAGFPLYFNHYIQSGSTGAHVRYVQERLNALGYSAGNADGIYGAKTEQAIKDFQSKNNLEVDGVVGPLTWNSLFRTRPTAGKGSGGGNNGGGDDGGGDNGGGSGGSGEKCVNGVDFDKDLSSIASCLKDKDFAFAARYLDGPCYPSGSDVLTKDEAKTLSDNGLYIVSIYSGANNYQAGSKHVVCGTQTESQGKQDAQASISLAGKVGQPSNTDIYLDIEANEVGDAWIDYVHGFVTELKSDGKYNPGVYSQPSQLKVLHSESWAGESIKYWNAEASKQEIQPKGTCPSESSISYADIWQYNIPEAGPIKTCGIVMDYDCAKGTKGMWKLNS